LHGVQAVARSSRAAPTTKLLPVGRSFFVYIFALKSFLSMGQANLEPDASDLITQAHHSCLNCETSFQGSFCPACGQSVKAFDKPLKLYIGDLLGNMFALDSRFWRTFTALFAKPGTWIAEYTGGRHVRYMPPFRLYFFVSVVFFLLLGYSGSKQLKDNFQRLSVNNISADGESQILVAGADSMSVTKDKASETNDYQLPMPGININMKTSEDTGQLNQRIGDVLKSPEQYLNRFFTYISWALFFLMPVLGFFLWLMFRFQRKYYIPHLFFAINQHSMLFILMIVVLLIGLAFPGRQSSPESYVLFVMPVYAIVGARQLYKNRWPGLLVRLSLAFFMYMFTVFVATGFIFYLAFLG
jgi:hypothetical protein